MKQKIIIFYTLIILNCNIVNTQNIHYSYDATYKENAKLWERIPKDNVLNVMERFIDFNDINNCFQWMESKTTLFLKCWRYDGLVDVKIDVLEDKNSPSLTLYI